MATPKLKKSLKRKFPQNLNDAPMIVPTSGSATRRALDEYFSTMNVKPHIVAEIADSALTKVLGADGVGVFAVPTVIEEPVAKQFGVHVLGRSEQVSDQFYAISTERKIQHPSVLAICDSARGELFAKE